MVGRTPEYLGKKIESFEMKMASLVVLVPVAGRCWSARPSRWLSRRRRPAIANPGPHGFSEILYAFSSTSNNNGSAFAGLNANTPFYNIAMGLAMLVGRFLAQDAGPGHRRVAGAQEDDPGRAPARCRRTARCSWCC